MYILIVYTMFFRQIAIDHVKFKSRLSCERALYELGKTNDNPNLRIKGLCVRGN